MRAAACRPPRPHEPVRPRARRANRCHAACPAQLIYDRYTLPSMDILKAKGTYTTDGLVSGKFQITRDFDSNLAISVDFESMTIATPEPKRA